MVNMELYKTVRREAEATQIIEKSKFIAYVKPAESKEEADAFIASIRKKHRDATHNVPAMVIGDKFQIQWASDDGEPQGTSGAPIVQMLVNEGITNVAIVVTRYFGGIKLGTGGLVRAYTSSAKLGLDAAGVCSVGEVCSMYVKVDYTYLSKMQNMAAAELGGFGAGGDVNAGAESVKLERSNVRKAAANDANAKHHSKSNVSLDANANADGKANGNISANGNARSNTAPAFLIKDLQYTDKVGFELLTLPEHEESIIALLANVTSGSAEVSGRKIVLEKL